MIGQRDATIIIRLPVDLAFARGFDPGEVARIREIALEHRAFFVERWNEHFGPELRAARPLGRARD